MRCRNCDMPHLVFERRTTSPYPRPSPDLLLSHAVIPDNTKEESKDCIQGIQARLSQLAELTAYLTTLSQELEAEKALYEEERHDLLDALKEHRIITAPIRTLSDDALREIFMTYVEAQVHPSSKAQIPAAMNLSWVCQRWRDVGVATPHLWSKIHFILFPDMPVYALHTNLVTMANIFGLYRDRSAACPLHITIKIPFTLNDQSSYYIEAAPNSRQSWVDTIAASAYRWQTLHMACVPTFLHEMHKSISACPSNSLAMLQKAEVNFIHGPRAVQDLQLLAVAPKLRCVDLGLEECSALAFEVPWGQIYTWRGALSSVEELGQLFMRSPNLLRCDVRMSKYHAGSRALDSPVRHDTLQTFEFDPLDGQLCQVLESIELPSLVELRIRRTRGHGQWGSDSFDGFLQRSSCLLQRLVLDVGYFCGDQLCEMLQTVPSLVGLECVESGCSPHLPSTISNLLLERLTFKSAISSEPPSTPLLPKLRTLSFLGSFWHDIPTALIPMLESRINCPSPLQSFYLQLEPWCLCLKAERGPALDSQGADAVKKAMVDTPLEIIIVDIAGLESIAFPEL